MMNLAEYRKRPACLADFLPWAALVAPGVVLDKDGSFLRCARFRGPDLDSSTESELVLATSRINNALKRLGSGWALFVEAERREAQCYPQSAFPDALSWLIDEERRGAFEEAGSHFESLYALTLVYLPPAEVKARASRLLYESPEHATVDWREQLAAFITETDRFLGLLEAVMPEIHWLDDGQTLTYLHSTVSMRRHPVEVPEVPFALDALLTDEPLTGGLAPMLGDAHLRVITVRGLPASTWPGMLDELNRLGFGTSIERTTPTYNSTLFASVREHYSIRIQSATRISVVFDRKCRVVENSAALGMHMPSFCRNLSETESSIFSQTALQQTPRLTSEREGWEQRKTCPPSWTLLGPARLRMYTCCTSSPLPGRGSSCAAIRVTCVIGSVIAVASRHASPHGGESLRWSTRGSMRGRPRRSG